MASADGRRFDIPHGLTKVGRAPDNQLVLLSPVVSRLHALLERQSDAVWLTDLGSSGGTFVNDKLLSRDERAALNSKDTICFGRSERFTIFGCSAPEASLPTVTLPAPPSYAPEPREITITVGDREPPPPEPTGPEPHSLASADFGFQPNDIEFVKHGIGTEAASKLARRFRFIQEIKSGGMGKVVLVQEILSGRFVALKIMLEAAASKEELVQQFVREAVITARLQHPHIVPIHDLGFLEGKQLYYTMSYIEGESFHALMPALDLAERVRILRCAALAVSHAHSKGLWRRDIKPQNILVGALGDTYVIDWGLVSVENGKEYRLNIPRIIVERVQYTLPDKLLVETNEAITGHSEHILGTPSYMAPEVIARKTSHLGAVSDIWAFGIMLFEAITGRHPVVEKGTHDPVQIWEKIMYDDFPAPSDIDSSAPPDLNELCRRMLAKDPRERVQSLKSVIDTFAIYLRSHPGQFTFYGVASRGRADVDKEVATPPTIEKDAAGVLRQENARLNGEVERYKMKNQLLVELAQLGWFEARRRRELWSKLADL
jgi:serine/threonine protein kinase